MNADHEQERIDRRTQCLAVLVNAAAYQLSCKNGVKMHEPEMYENLLPVSERLLEGANIRRDYAADAVIDLITEFPL